MSTDEAGPLLRATPARPAAVAARSRGGPPSSPLQQFEQVYVGNVDGVMGYFARRTAEPQTVADLTSETDRRRA